jgi:hypothetical protein
MRGTSRSIAGFSKAGMMSARRYLHTWEGAHGAHARAEGPCGAHVGHMHTLTGHARPVYALPLTS